MSTPGGWTGGWTGGWGTGTPDPTIAGPSAPTAPRDLPEVWQRRDDGFATDWLGGWTYLRVDEVGANAVGSWEMRIPAVNASMGLSTLLARIDADPYTPRGIYIQTPAGRRTGGFVAVVRRDTTADGDIYTLTGPLDQVIFEWRLCYPVGATSLDDPVGSYYSQRDATYISDIWHRLIRHQMGYEAPAARQIGALRSVINSASDEAGVWSVSTHPDETVGDVLRRTARGDIQVRVDPSPEGFTAVIESVRDRPDVIISPDWGTASAMTDTWRAPAVTVASTGQAQAYTTRTQGATTGWGRREGYLSTTDDPASALFGWLREAQPGRSVTAALPEDGPYGYWQGPLALHMGDRVRVLTDPETGAKVVRSVVAVRTEWTTAGANTQIELGDRPFRQWPVAPAPQTILAGTVPTSVFSDPLAGINIQYGGTTL